MLIQKIGIIVIISVFSILVYINTVIKTSNDVFISYYRELVYNLTSNLNYDITKPFLEDLSTTNPAYTKIKYYLDEFTKRLGIKDVYLSTIDSLDREILLVNSATDGDDIGKIIESKYGLMAFTYKEMMYGIIKDKTSSYYSFYSPILDESGESIALISLTLPRKVLLQLTQRKIIKTVLVVLFLNLLVIFFFIYIATVSLWKILHPIYIIKDQVLNISNKILSVNRNIKFTTHEFNLIEKLFLKSVLMIRNFIFSLVVYFEYIKFSISKIKVISFDILNKTKSATNYITKVSKLNEDINTEVFKLKNKMDIFSKDIHSITDEIKNILVLNKSAIEICQHNNEFLNEFLVEITILIKNFRSEQTKCQNLTILSNKINDILGDILTITNETKLLSLNASIVAISAGEHGKSFGVIAKEVGELSQNIIKSTGYIKQTLIKISETINVLNRESIEIFEAFKTHSDKSRIFSTNLTEIYNSIKNITLYLKNISLSSDKLNNKNEIILDNVTFLNKNSSSNFNSIKQIENLIAKVNDIAIAFRNSFDDLDERINKIKLDLRQFKI